MKQLAAARAVITIWSPNSVRSDWVRAEAGRAKADGKLIPVKTPELTYADIPLPFGEMHTENIASTDLIRAAIVAQLAKPAVPVSQFWQITGIFEYQILTWIGIVGSTITLFANLSGILNLADWAKEVVAHWHEWNQVIWGWIFSFINIKVPKELVPTISFTVSVGILVAGLNLQARTDELQSTVPSTKRVKVLIRGLGLYLCALVVITLLFSIITSVIIASRLDPALPLSSADVPDFGLLAYLLGLVAVIGVPMAYLLYVADERSWVFVNSLLFLFMASCLLLLPLGVLRPPSMGPIETFAAMFSTFVLL
jgi:hypothetical protein